MNNYRIMLETSIINLIGVLLQEVTETATATMAGLGDTLVLFLIFLSGINNFNNPPLNQN